MCNECAQFLVFIPVIGLQSLRLPHVYRVVHGTFWACPQAEALSLRQDFSEIQRHSVLFASDPRHQRVCFDLTLVLAEDEVSMRAAVVDEAVGLRTRI